MKKSVAKIFLPDYRFKKITEISSDFFSGAGLIVFDVDNTLVFSETTEAKKEIVDWFCEINNRYRCVCVSNSRTIKQRQEKIEKFTAALTEAESIKNEAEASLIKPGPVFIEIFLPQRP